MPAPGRLLLLTLLAGSALCATGVGGCRRKHVDGTVAVDAVLNEWKAKGIPTETVKSLEPDQWSAGACSRGLVVGLDVLMCEYSADETLAIGEQKIVTEWEESGVATGVVLRNSRTLLAVADKTKTDPSGRTIMRLVEAFRLAH